MADDRSTLQFLYRIGEIEDGREVVVLTGNTTDAYVGPDGQAYAMTHLLAHDAARRGMALIVYSIAGGARQINPGGRMVAVSIRYPGSGSRPSEALSDLINQLGTVDQRCRIVIDYADLLFPSGGSGDVGTREQEYCIELLAEQAVAQSNSQSHHRLVIVSRAGGVPDNRLVQLPGFQGIEVPLPNRAERAAVVAQAFRSGKSGTPFLADGLDQETFVRLTGGLVTDDLMRGMFRVRETGVPLDGGWIQQRKTETLRRLAGDSLIVYPPGNGLADVAGLSQVRLLLDEAKRTGRPPRRILLAGPPGVGKTLVVRAIADELSYPAVALGNYRNMYVGETERLFRRAIGIISELAPCVLHIDEIDQSIGQRTTGQSADGGTSERVLADLWTFLGDSTRSERVVVVATTNRPELLDPAMFDRFTIVPVLHPTPAEAADIMVIAARREGADLDRDEALDALSRHPGMVTGRVLVDVVDRALTFADLAGTSLAGAHLELALDDLLMALDVAQHEELALRALALTTFQSYLPWIAAQRRNETPYVPSYVSALQDQTGSIDMAALRRRLGNGPRAED